MREIKFKYIFKGFPFSSTDSGFNWHVKVFTLSQIEGGTLRLSNLEDALGEIVARVQFTDLTDVNGVEIYEGDIIKASAVRLNDRNGYGLFEVVYDSVYGSYAGHLLKWVCSVGSPVNFPLGELRFNSEIIGNKYQNPELLEQ